MNVSEYELYDGLGLSALLYAKEVSPVELLRCAIELAECRGESCNAIIYPKYEAALNSAENRELVGSFGALPFLLKDSGLAIPRVPVAVGVTGMGALPREGDVVVVLFPRGELASPIVIAQVYNDQRRPPKFERDELKLVWPGEVDDPDTKAVQVSIKVADDARTLAVVRFFPRSPSSTMPRCR